MVDREDIKRQVQQSTDIVRLIGEQVSLRPRGREFVCVCPFHDDTNPSMYVSPAKQIYKCFACGAGGDCFSFVMDYHKMTFPEALKHLADRAGIALPQRNEPTPADQQKAGDRDLIRQANEQAVRFFQQMYQHEQHGQLARAYVAKRSISDDMLNAFAIGYAPDRWDGLALTIEHRNWDLRGFQLAGLIKHRNTDTNLETRNSKPETFYDSLRHRLVFPIFDAIGRPVAFGGRKLRDEDEPKYLNSPETLVFNKSATLFGLHLAKKPIIDSRVAVIVEGYTDVIACHQHGFRNVVATLGTALTRQHAAELRRYADKVVLIFDADEAGYKAADRALEIFFAEPLDVAIAVLPDGLDPADLMARDDGPAIWRQAVADAADATAYHFARVRQAFNNQNSMTGKQRIAEEYLRSLVQLGLRHLEPARRGMVLHQVADLLKLNVDVVQNMVRGMLQSNRPAAPQAEAERSAASGSAVSPTGARTQAERLITGCLLNDSSLFHATMPGGRDLSEAVMPLDINDEPTRRVYAAVHDYLSEHDALDANDLRNVLEDESLLRHALDLKYHLDRLCGEDREKLLTELAAAVRALLAMLADHAYAEHKLRMNVEPANITNVEMSVEKRLQLATQHGLAHPSAYRTPRVAH
ncbi:MAG: DNA primase [Phycisphaeraceae bacterium]